MKIFAVMIEPVWVSLNAMDVGQNGSEQTIIVVLVLDIDNALVTQPFWRLDKRHFPNCRSIEAQVYGKTLDRIKLPTRANTDIPCDQIERTV